MKIIVEYVLRFLYRILNGITYNYSYNKEYDDIIKTLILKEVDKIKITDYDIKIKFKCGMECELWNANKWFSWLDSGYIKDINGENFKFRGLRPSSLTMRRFNKFINENTQSQKNFYGIKLTNKNEDRVEKIKSILQ